MSDIDRIKDAVKSLAAGEDHSIPSKMLADALHEAGMNEEAKLWEEVGDLEPHYDCHAYWWYQHACMWARQNPQAGLVDGIFKLLPADRHYDYPARHRTLCWATREDAMNALKEALRRFIENSHRP